MASNASGPSLHHDVQRVVFDRLVGNECPVITLRDQKHFDEIISKLINDSKLSDEEKAKDDVRQMVEKAIWSPAAIRPNMMAQTDLLSACISQLSPLATGFETWIWL